MSTTIVGISTPFGMGAVGIVRVSGDKALALVCKYFKPYKLKTLSDGLPNTMYLGVFKAENFSDRCLAVYFAAPNSYTGEDVVELHCHGGMQLVSNVYRCLVNNEGIMDADRGEFTKRAFYNGKLKLTDCEGIVDMIEATGEQALNSAYRMMNGTFYRSMQALADKLLYAIGILEGGLDFPDEMEKQDLDKAIPLINQVLDELKKLYSTKEVGRYVKEGISVAIVGEPNVGKSSLLNAMLGKPRALVSALAGTTRDVVGESIVFEGVRLNLLDTAGLRNATDDIEKEGVKLSYETAKGADVVLYVIAGEYKALPKEFDNKKIIVVKNKSDVYSYQEGSITCCINGKGVDELLHQIADLAKQIPQQGEILTNQRHVKCVELAIKHITDGLTSYENMPLECALIDFRAALNALFNLIGVDTSEKIIDDIFKRFCIGK